MSYAEAAASAPGPAAPIKLPKPAELEVTTDPSGSIETVDAETFEKERKEAEKEAKAAVEKTSKEVKDVAEKTGKEVKKAAGVVRDEAEDLKKEAKKEWKDFKESSSVEQVVDYVKQQLANVSAYVSQTFSSENVAAVSTELQNPVVLGQLAVLGAGAAAGWYINSESHRIRSDNKYVVAIHAGVITAAVLADMYVFQALYPKYKK